MSTAYNESLAASAAPLGRMRVAPKISVISPAYLAELYERLRDTLERITTDFEIIWVNDASPDPRWETLQSLSNRDNRVKGINLSRNFGQHYASTAGLDYAKGHCVVVMDAASVNDNIYAQFALTARKNG